MGVPALAQSGGADAGESAVPHATPTPQQVIDSARTATVYLWGIVILFIVLLMGLYVLRVLRRARMKLLQKSDGPTEYTDAWAMHKLPPDLIEPPDIDDDG